MGEGISSRHSGDLICTLFYNVVTLGGEAG